MVHEGRGTVRVGRRIIGNFRHLRRAMVGAGQMLRNQHFSNFRGFPEFPAALFVARLVDRSAKPCANSADGSWRMSFSDILPI
jgi:hypothetical protein